MSGRKDIKLMSFYELFRKACITYTDEQVKNLTADFEASLTPEDKALMDKDELYVYDRAVIFLTLRISKESESLVAHVNEKL